MQLTVEVWNDNKQDGAVIERKRQWRSVKTYQ